MALKIKNRNIQTWLNASFREHANLINEKIADHIIFAKCII